jgi:hypothetical protein
MEDIIKKFISSKPLLLSFDEINRHPIGEKIEIFPGFTTERLPTTKKVLFFRVELKEGLTIKEGFHNCTEEVGLYSGELIETRTGEPVGRYENFKIRPFTKHGFKALKDSIFYVYLYL